MDATSSLSSAVQTFEDFLVCFQGLGVSIYLHTSHAVVDNGCHNGDVERILNIQRQIMKEFLSPLVVGFSATVFLVRSVFWVLRLLFCNLAIIFERLLNVCDRNVVFLRKFVHVLVAFHNAAPFVMLAMPFNLL